MVCVITYMELFIDSTVLCIHYAPSTYFCYLFLNSKDHNSYLKKQMLCPQQTIQKWTKTKKKGCLSW